MPQIGWFEIFIIVVLAVVILGPKDFPIVLSKIGNTIKKIKNYFSEVQNTLQETTKIYDDKDFDEQIDTKESEIKEKNKQSTK